MTMNHRLLKRRTIPRTTRLAIIAAITIILLFSLTNTYLAYQTPTTKQQTLVKVQYTNTGRFGYLVYLKNNTVYNKTVLRPGEGIYFTQLVDHINATFTYTFDIDTTATINGSYHIQALIQTKDWTKTYTLVPQTTFTISGQRATAVASFPINHTRYEQILGIINTETGVPALNPLLVIQAIVTLTADTNRGTVYSSFLPSINMTLGQKTIDFSQTLTTSSPGYLTETHTASLPQVYSSRNNWTVVSIIFLIGLIALLVATASRQEDKTAEILKKILKKYQDWIVEADHQPDAAKARIIHLKSIEDLAKIGEELGKPVIHYMLPHENGKTHMFFVIDEAIFYEYDLILDGKIKIVATCPQCDTKITYEDYPGRKINANCPNCGNRGVVSIEKKQKMAWNGLFSRSKKNP